MRYTTIIDISEIPAIYKNHNARILYLHLVLKAGYHDDDRDIVTVSIRNLAAYSGLTVSAVRHALGVLERAQLLTRTPQGYRVKKWVATETPTPRTSKNTAKSDPSLARLMREQEQQQLEFQRKLSAAVQTLTREQLEQWATELQEGRQVKHCGIRLNANRANIEYLKNEAKKK